MAPGADHEKVAVASASGTGQSAVAGTVRVVKAGPLAGGMVVGGAVVGGAVVGGAGSRWTRVGSVIGCERV